VLIGLFDSSHKGRKVMLTELLSAFSPLYSRLSSGTFPIEMQLMLDSSSCIIYVTLRRFRLLNVNSKNLKAPLEDFR
jgi:hypothetical protein